MHDPVCWSTRIPDDSLLVRLVSRSHCVGVYDESFDNNNSNNNKKKNNNRGEAHSNCRYDKYPNEKMMRRYTPPAQHVHCTIFLHPSFLSLFKIFSMHILFYYLPFSCKIKRRVNYPAIQFNYCSLSFPFYERNGRIVMPRTATFWFIITLPIVLIDGAYVLLRAPPGTYLDPSIHPYADTLPLSLWNTYAAHDHRYQSNDDAFVVAQTYLNFVEAALGLVALCVALLGFYRLGLATAIIVSLMTVYKTVIFFLMDVVEGGKFTKHNTFQEKLTVIWLPSSLWIIIPSIIILQCFNALLKLGAQSTSQHKKKK